MVATVSGLTVVPVVVDCELVAPGVVEVVRPGCTVVVLNEAIAGVVVVCVSCGLVVV